MGMSKRLSTSLDLVVLTSVSSSVRVGVGGRVKSGEEGQPQAEEGWHRPKRLQD